MKISTINYNNPKQGYLPLFLSDCLDMLDPVLTFDRLMGGIDLNKYLTDIPEYTTGRLRYNPVNMLKTVLFGFMISSYCSLRELEDNCKVNIRFMYLMDHQTPSYRTFGYFINEVLQDKIENIFNDINQARESVTDVRIILECLQEAYQMEGDMVRSGKNIHATMIYPFVRMLQEKCRDLTEEQIHKTLWKEYEISGADRMFVERASKILEQYEGESEDEK